MPAISTDQQKDLLSKRSIDDSKPSFLEETSKDDLDGAPNSDTAVEEIAKQPEQDIELLIEDTPPAAEDNFGVDLIPAGSSIVFRPLFVYRYQQIKRRRRPRSAEEPVSATDEMMDYVETKEMLTQ